MGSEGGDEVSTDDSGDDADIWWSHFKELMERSSAYAVEFEDQFLSTQKDEEEGAAVADIATECSEHVSNATGILPNNNDEGLGQFANKTVVFSGSGTKKKQPPRRHTAATAASDCSSPPTSSFNAADQVMLLHDLERRIKTLGLAEEVIVNEDTSDCNDANCCCEGLEGKQTEDIPSSNHGGDRQREEEGNRKKNRPFFLGVSGPMLSELSSTMNLTWNDGISKEECWDMS